MKYIKKCLNEWNSVIEALGHCQQTILVRKYSTTLDKFLLYPTVSYANKNGFLKSFQNKYLSFAKENALPRRDGKKIEVKYYAEVEKIIEKPSTRIGTLKKYFIWTPDHVRSYMGSKKAYVWILRVYKLKEPVMAKRTMGMRYANLLEEVSLEGIKPVISDSEFSKIVQEIENK